MPVVALQDVEVSFGAEDVIRGVTCELNAGDRVGLIGRNGAGKTTLLEVLAGEMSPTSGRRHVARHTRVALVQQVPAETSSGTTIEEEALSALDYLINLERDLAEAAHDLSAGVEGAEERYTAAARPLRGERLRLQLPRASVRGAHGPRLPRGRVEQARSAAQRRPAQPPRPRQGAALRARPPAHGRADQPPRPRRAVLARRLPRALAAHALGHLARPLLPRPRRHADLGWSPRAVSRPTRATTRSRSSSAWRTSRGSRRTSRRSRSTSPRSRTSSAATGPGSAPRRPRAAPSASPAWSASRRRGLSATRSSTSRPRAPATSSCRVRT